jgi:hypothetical protein
MRWRHQCQDDFRARLGPGWLEVLSTIGNRQSLLHPACPPSTLRMPLANPGVWEVQSHRQRILRWYESAEKSWKFWGLMPVCQARTN